MSIRDNLDISAYLVLGPENTLGRPVGDVVAQALDAGFTHVTVFRDRKPVQIALK